MKSSLKRIIAAAAAALMLVSFAACSARSNQDSTPAPIASDPTREPSPTVDPALLENVIRITFTVDATGAYTNAYLPAEVKAQLTGNGMLINNAQVSMPKGSTVTDLFRVLEIYSIPVVAEEGENGSAITSIKGVANGLCGEDSRWQLLINGEEVTESVDTVVLNDGDSVSFIYLPGEGAPVVTEPATATGNSDSHRDGTPDPNATPDPGAKTHG